MPRTQIYLSDALHERLKARAHDEGISMSELIRRTLLQELAKAPAADARAFFDRLRPLESFAGSTAAAYMSPERVSPARRGGLTVLAQRLRGLAPLPAQYHEPHQPKPCGEHRVAAGFGHGGY